MKRPIKAAAAAIALTWAVTATAGPARSILLQHTDGSKTQITMANDLSTTFDGGMMTVKSEKGVLEYPLANISNWTFASTEGEIWSGIDRAESEIFSIKLSADGVTLRNLHVRSAVTLTGSDGQTIKVMEAEGDEFLSFNGLAPGVYLLTVNGKTYKISVN